MVGSGDGTRPFLLTKGAVVRTGDGLEARGGATTRLQAVGGSRYATRTSE